MKGLKYKYESLLLYALFCGVAITWLSSCAQTGRLTGGARDKTPPVLDTLRSSISRQVNQSPRELTFYFDEYVEVKDALKQVLISPPLTYIATIKEKGKRVTFKLDKKEVLKENTTYTINFGDAIKDFHESNVYKNFKFVFATGPNLDSLSISGTVTDALSDKAPEEIFVFLYDEVSDSIVSKKKPLYSTRTDKEGKFTFENIRSDTFKIFALKDLNINYLYDLPSEFIAFGDSLIYLNADSTPTFNLRMSKPIPTFGISTVNTKTYGKVNVAFNQGGKKIEYTTDKDSLVIYPEITNDSLNLYYASIDSFTVFMPGFDTVKVKPRVPRDFLKKNKLKTVSITNTNQMLVGDTIKLVFNYPLMDFDTSRMKLSDDIGVISNYEVALDESHKKLLIFYNWTEGIAYELSIDSAALKSIYGHNNDSIGIKAKILTIEQQGSLVANFVDLDSTAHYFISMLRNNMVVATQAVSGTSKFSLKKTGLVPDRYDFTIVKDDNKNGRWDPGDYWSHVQPEYIKTIKGDRTRENWETIVTMSWKTGALIGAVEPNVPAAGLQPDINNKGKN